mgnify:CR=1 FL=1
MLTSTGELIEALTTLLVEHLNLLTAYLYLRYLENYLCTLNDWGTNGDCTVIVNEEHLLDGDLIANLSTCDVQNADLLIWLNIELLALNLNNCVHCYYKNLIVSPQGEHPNDGHYLWGLHRNQHAKITILSFSASYFIHFFYQMSYFCPKYAKLLSEDDYFEPQNCKILQVFLRIQRLPPGRIVLQPLGKPRHGGIVPGDALVIVEDVMLLVRNADERCLAAKEAQGSEHLQ